MKQLTDAEKERLYPMMAKVADYLLERLAVHEAYQAQASSQQHVGDQLKGSAYQAQEPQSASMSNPDSTRQTVAYDVPLSELTETVTN